MDIKLFLVSTMHYWLPVAIALATVASLFVATKLSKEKLEKIQSVVRYVDEQFGKYLPDKQQYLLDVWVEALAEIIKDGDYTPSEMLDTFVKIIKKGLDSKNVKLSKEEEEVVIAAAATTVGIMSVDSKRTIKAFQAQSLNLKN